MEQGVRILQDPSKSPLQLVEWRTEKNLGEKVYLRFQLFYMTISYQGYTRQAGSRDQIVKEHVWAEI